MHIPLFIYSFLFSRTINSHKSTLSRSSGGGLAFLLRDTGSTPTWCRVMHWWAMIGDPGKPGLDS
ncbi:hypothetical protein Hanom_Chr07g00674891 [Helianthus anomalus]